MFHGFSEMSAFVFWISESERSQFDNFRSGVKNNLPGTVTNLRSWRSHSDGGKHRGDPLCVRKSRLRFAEYAGGTTIQNVVVPTFQNFDSDFNFL